MSTVTAYLYVLNTFTVKMHSHNYVHSNHKNVQCNRSYYIISLLYVISQTSMRRWANVGLLLGQRRRRLMFAGLPDGNTIENKCIF